MARIRIDPDSASLLACMIQGGSFDEWKEDLMGLEGEALLIALLMFNKIAIADVPERITKALVDLTKWRDNL